MSGFWLGMATPLVVLGIVYIIWILRGGPGGWGP
jgi:hypothetical protein